MMKIFNYNFLKKSIGSYIEIKFPNCFQLLSKHRIGIKYIFSGGTAALVDLAVLYFLTDIIGLWYMISTIIAFVLALLTSFFLQKFWTFRDNGMKRIKKQMIIYAIVGTLNFILNPILLFIVVEKFHIWYMLAATIIMGVLAIANYSVNKFITFKKDIAHESVNL